MKNHDSLLNGFTLVHFPGQAWDSIGFQELTFQEVFCYDSKRKTSNSIDGFKPNLSHFSFWKSLHKKHVFRTFWGLSGGKRSKFYKRLCTRVSLQNAGRAGQVHSDHPPAFLGLLLHYLAGHRSFLPVIMGLFANKEAPFLDLLGVTIPSDHCCWSSHHRVSTPNSPAHTVDWHSGSCRGCRPSQALWRHGVRHHGLL